MYSTKDVHLHLVLFLLNRLWFEWQMKLPASKHWILLLRIYTVLKGKVPKCSYPLKVRRLSKEWIDNYIPSFTLAEPSTCSSEPIGNIVWKIFCHIITGISMVINWCGTNKVVPSLNTNYWEEEKLRARHRFRVSQPMFTQDRGSPKILPLKETNKTV